MSVVNQMQLAALLDELVAAMGEIAGAPLDGAAAGDAAASRQWVATLTGDTAGACVLTFDGEGAIAFSRAASPANSDGEDAAIADLLRNAVSRAAASLAARSGPERLDLTLTTLEPAAAGEPAAHADRRTVAAAGWTRPLTVTVHWEDGAGALQQPEAGGQDETLGNRIDVILDIDLPVVVRFGHTELPIRTLSRLGPGSVIDLGRSPDDPVEVLVSNRVVARGEVVIVGGNYGVRILEVASQSERVRSMEA